MKKDFQRN